MGTNGSASAPSGDFGLHPISECQQVEKKDGVDNCKLEEKSLTSEEAKMLAAFREFESSAKASAKLGIDANRFKKCLKQIASKMGLETTLDLLSHAKRDPSTVNTVTAAKLIKLIAEQQYRCALSGVELEPETAVLDHKVPRNRGGKHEIENVWFLHRDVNRAKGTMTVDEFRLMCSRVAQWGS